MRVVEVELGKKEQDMLLQMHKNPQIYFEQADINVCGKLMIIGDMNTSKVTVILGVKFGKTYDENTDFSSILNVEARDIEFIIYGKYMIINPHTAERIALKITRR